MSKFKLLNVLVLFGLLLVPLGISVRGADAAYYSPDGSFMWEGFNYFFEKPHPLADWHTLSFGVDEFGNNTLPDGSVYRMPGNCGSNTCATAETEGWTKYLRMSLEGDPSGHYGYYTNTDVSEVELWQPGATESGQWNTAPGESLLLSARVRWSDNFNQDGTGGAVGTSGVWLWNSPYEGDEFFPHYETNIDAIGFNWSTIDSLGGFLSGFRTTVLMDSQPIFSNPIPFTVDINDWILLNILIEEDATGVQTVSFYVDGQLASTTVLPVHYQNLAIELWNDNQVPQFNPQGGIDISYPAPVEDQTFDVDFVSAVEY